MSRFAKRLAWFSVCLLPFGGLYCLYFVLFSAWNTALPHADVTAWQNDCYRWIDLGIVVLVLWVVSVLTVVRTRLKTLKTWPSDSRQILVAMIEEDRSRRLRANIRTIFLRDWDPIGVCDEPNAQDEYDGYLDHVFALLEKHQSAEIIAEYLYEVETVRMGLVNLEGEALLPASKRFLAATNLQAMFLAEMAIL